MLWSYVYQAGRGDRSACVPACFLPVVEFGFELLIVNWIWDLPIVIWVWSCLSLFGLGLPIVIWDWDLPPDRVSRVLHERT